MAIWYIWYIFSRFGTVKNLATLCRSYLPTAVTVAALFAFVNGSITR
jgi:hypothetical protein